MYRPKALPLIMAVEMNDQRFTTVGDWYADPVTGQYFITLADLHDWRYTFLVLLHELVEWAISRANGVSSAEADNFDAVWESEIWAGLHSPEEEAGFDRRCPYRKGHKWGARMERLFAWLLKVDWKKYCEVCDTYCQELSNHIAWRRQAE